VGTNRQKFSQSTRRFDAILYQLTEATSDLESRIGTEVREIAEKSAESTGAALSYNGLEEAEFERSAQWSTERRASCFNSASP
jgi:hypothetical protein